MLIDMINPNNDPMNEATLPCRAFVCGIQIPQLF